MRDEKGAAPGPPHAADFPIVGIGASAGGLAAFEAFFSGLPPQGEPGMAFVLVQHLSPDYKSLLADLIQRGTRMKVIEVRDGMAVEKNCAYTIPPNRDMSLLDGKLHLMEPAEPHGQRLPIDSFFQSLAQDQRERAIGVVLSGTGADGTLGLRAIKAAGGLAMVQDGASAEFRGMPDSAAAAGLADFQLAPEAMPAALMAYAKRMVQGPLQADSERPSDALQKVFVLLRARTGHDFSHYKPSSILRRIQRRTAIHQIQSLDDYVRYLQQSPGEAAQLFGDLLIGVTRFFRDPEAFQALEDQVIPALFATRAEGAAIRVWCPGCSTGEEAYSIAMLLWERMKALKQGVKLQVFATDIDARAVAHARAGVYAASAAADVGKARLERFFTPMPESGSYRVRKEIRDLLVFSEQDLIRDPPFSKLDLISCRNLLIYLDADLQKRLLPLFHFALKQGSWLFLGNSESIGEFGDLFAVMDRGAKLFVSKENSRGARRAMLGGILPSPGGMRGMPRHDGAKLGAAMKDSLKDLAEQALLKQASQAAALVNGQGDILYLHGRAGPYMELAPGESGVNNLLKMAREGLQRDLTVGLHKVVTQGEMVLCPGLHVETNKGLVTVDVSIRAVPTPSATAPEERLYLVIFNDVPAKPAEKKAPGGSKPGAASANQALQQELRAKEEFVQTTNEELRTANEELRSSNEEMQSLNEELQSSNEEMETSKEELQSLNEELATVNAELQTKLGDLSQANNDMNNLLAGTGIATVFVDHQLRILRFTPAATRLINLIPGDVNRPVGHVVSNLVAYDRLSDDVQGVLDTLAPKELEVQTKEGAWYTLRIQPYRTLDNVIEGAVITFMDITEMKRTALELKRAQAKLLEARKEP